MGHFIYPPFINELMNGILNIFYYSIITKIDLQNHFVKKIFLNYNSTMFVW
jgi:hypothetical protein